MIATTTGKNHGQHRFRMVLKLITIGVVFVILGGCATVATETGEQVQAVKRFPVPDPGKSGIYVYRDSVLGSALKKDIWIDGECVGETAPKVFFYRQVAGGLDHKVSTESEFSPNDLVIHTDPGRNYFVRQYIKLGLLVGGAGLELVDEKTGKAAIQELEMAVGGHCSGS